MPEELVPGISPLTLNLSFRQPLTRRQMLRTLAAGSVAVVGGSVLAACGGSSTPGKATLRIGAWPIAATPPKKDDTNGVAHWDVLQQWLKNNPNVKLTTTTIKVDDGPSLRTAIIGNRAPAMYGLNFGSPGANRAAAGTGLVADMTSFYKDSSRGFTTNIADYAKKMFEANFNWAGHYFGLPGDAVIPGFGFLIRRDLLKKYNIPEPDPNTWTWDDFHTIAKTFSQAKGSAACYMPEWGVGVRQNSNGLDAPFLGGGVLGAIPTLGTSNLYHWQVDTLNWKSEWQEVISKYQSWINDGSIIHGAAYDVFPSSMAFANDQAWLVLTLGLFPTFLTWEQGPIANLAKQSGAAYDEYVTLLPLPKGDNGAWNDISEPKFGAAAFDPHMSQESLSATVNLYEYMFYGPGYSDIRYEAYKKSGQIQQAYDYIAPGNKWQHNPKLAANQTVDVIYGQRLFQSIMNNVNSPVRPQIASYYPAYDTQPDPLGVLHDNLTNTLNNGTSDVTTALTTFQTNQNAQLAGMQSDLTPDQFKEGATKYFKAFDTFWQQNSQKFWSGDWNKYYNTMVLPALNGQKVNIGG